MKRHQVDGIILKRVNYAEADRIITFLTPTQGKVSAIAKGVRKPKSKLAGGLELFSVCQLSLIEGKGNLQTIVSTRLKTYFDQLITDYSRMELAYDVIRLTDAYSDDQATAEYYVLLQTALEALNDSKLSDHVVMAWFLMQLSKLNGSLPNLLTDHEDKELKENQIYAFSVEDGTFFVSEMGTFGAKEIKAWRVFVTADIDQLSVVSGLESPAQSSIGTLKNFVEFQM